MAENPPGGGKGRERAGAADRVEWRRRPADELPAPIAREVPLLELVLEHPDVEATRVGTAFFPAAVPYRLDGVPRLFYWQSALGDDSPPPACWGGAVATPDVLAPVTDEDGALPPLVDRCADGTEVVVDGGVASETTTTVLADYDPPAVGLRSLVSDRAVVAVDGEPVTVPAGERERVYLGAQDVANRDREGDIGNSEREEDVGNSERDGSPGTTVSPRLSIRYPGERLVVHPGRDASYALFPSFGLDLDAVPNPVPVETSGDAVDHEAIAETLGVALDERPYPERVLWQAFCYAAFAPSGAERPAIAQFDAGRLAVAPPPRLGPGT